jgi:hypothetical protein
MSQRTELDRLSDDEIRKLWTGVQALNQTPAGRALIRRAAEEARSSKHPNNNSRPVAMPSNFDPLEQLQSFIGQDEQSE